LSQAIKEAEGRGVDIINVGFSMLRAHTNIPIHQGDQNGLLRYHLGLSIPEGAGENAALLLWAPGRSPPSKPQKLTWFNGADFVFDDSNVHTVYNRLGSNRVVLMVDFVKPAELWDEGRSLSWAHGPMRQVLVYLHRHVIREAMPKDAMIFENQNRHCSSVPGCFGGS
jgi:aspartyl/asparaginyl beta-hydroxylase (cupin superfamily)